MTYPKYSIVIPTYNHCNDLLKPCLDSLIACTDLSEVEVIVVANGCTDNTREYVNSLGSKFRLIWIDEPLGYIKPTNIGIKEAKGEFIVLLNNDVFFINDPQNPWLPVLEAPFKDPKVGITGPHKNLMVYWSYAEETRKVFFRNEFMTFYCAMIKRDVINTIGLLDEDFGLGYQEDVDYSIRAAKAGYKIVQVPNDYNYDLNLTTEYLEENPNVNYNFPVVHFNNMTFKDLEIQSNDDVLQRKHPAPKYSIVIPTYNHLEDLLKPCLESIMKYTDLSNVEVIVVANGCVDGTEDYVRSLGHPFKLFHIKDAVGYTIATNEGIKVSQGEYVILLNNDTELLPQNKNVWLNMLEGCFTDPSVGLAGPLQLHDDYADFDVLIFFCVMIRRELFDKIGLLDEIFTPGGGEDIDFTVRANLAGYKSVALQSRYVPEESTNVGNIPIWHKDNRTFKEIPEYTKVIVKRNGLINCKRYNKNIKLNVGSGGIEFKGYLSVDLYDQRAHVIMDITKLDFDPNSVTEILASHVFEHLNPYHCFDILANWFEVLKPGGRLVMEMPNIEEVCKQFTVSDKQGKYAMLNCMYGSVNTTSEGGVGNPLGLITSPHLFGWWPESLYDHLAGVGFTDIVFMPEQIPHPGPNLRVEATKPLA